MTGSADATTARPEQHEPLVPAPPCLMQRLQGRRRRAEHDRDAALPRPPHGNVAPVIAHAFLLLERCIVLFIDDDETEARHRREYGEPRAQHEIGLAGCGSAPVPAAHRCGKAAVEHHRVAPGQRFRDPLRKLRCQVDFRDEQQGLTASVDARRRGREIDVGLAASRDAVKQKRRIAPVCLRDREQPRAAARR